MSIALAPPPFQKFFANNGEPLALGLVFTYISGTPTKQVTYNGSGGNNANPIVLNARGEADILLDTSLTYTFVIAPPGDTDPPSFPIKQIDNIAAALTVAQITQSFLGGILYPQTQAEQAAGVTPVNKIYPPGNVLRYGAKGDGATDDSAAINAAAKCNEVVFFPTPSASYGISAPIYITSTAPLNITFLGESRTNTIIQPLQTNIADVLSINAMFINQQSNGKASWSNLRLSSQLVAYTGVCIYAVQGGAGGTAQCIFSGSMDNCWFDPGSTNTGFFLGGLDNYRVSDCTFEFQKGCFYLEGSGGAGDVIFTDNVLSNCYDYFVQKIDSTACNLISVKGLHAYTHNRGVLFNITNGECVVIEDVILQASTGGANLGSIGIGAFQNLTDLQVYGVNVMTNAGIGTGATATQLTFNAVTGQVHSSIIDGSDTGILITGGANRLSFVGVDIVNTLTAAFKTSTATASGLITVNGCNWSDGQADLITFTTNATFDFLMTGSRIMNAGLGASSGSRNVKVNTNATARFSDCQIGQNNVSAAAAYYFDDSGSGAVKVVDCEIAGTPPTGVSTGSLAVTWDGASGTWTPSVGGSATYTTQLGGYSIKSKCVTFWGQLTINVIGSGSLTTVSGLPFMSNSTFYGTGMAPFFASIATSVTSLGLTVAPSGTSFQFRTLTAAAGSTGTANVFQNSANVMFGGSYQIP